MRLEVVGVVEAISQLVNKGYDREYRIKDGYLFDLALNVLQKLAYTGVVFGLGPLIALTGLTMSPTIDAAFPGLLTLFGGRQGARTIHFIACFAFVGFIVVHLVQVVLTGVVNNLRSMITG